MKRILVLGLLLLTLSPMKFAQLAHSGGGMGSPAVQIRIPPKAFLSVTSAGAALTWTEPIWRITTDGPSYRVRWGSDPAALSNVLDTGHVREAQISDIHPETEYYFVVEVYDEVGEWGLGSNVMRGEVPPPGIRMVVCGYMVNDSEWSSEGGPYLVDCSVNVSGNATLEIAPGTQVLFRENDPQNPDDPPVGLEVGAGSLHALGEVGTPILFQSASDSPHPGSWGSLVFGPESFDCSLDNCVIEYAGQGADPAHPNDFGSINFLETSPSISRCSIRQSATSGVFGESAYESAPVIDRNTFSDNSDYDVKILGHGQPQLSNNVLSRAAWLEGEPAVTDNIFNSYETHHSWCHRDGSDFACMLRIGAKGENHLSGNTFNGTDGGSRIEVVPDVCEADGVPAPVEECEWEIPIVGNSEPTGLSVSFSTTSANLKWHSLSPRSDAWHIEPPPTRYRVLWGIEPQSYDHVYDAGTNLYAEIYPLDPGKTYYFVVLPQDALGNRPLTNEVTGELATGGGPTEVCGHIGTNTTWTVAGSPYVVTCSIDVYSDSLVPAILAIGPGVNVRFEDGTSLNIGDVANHAGHGGLVAEGTETNPVVFSSNSSSPSPGSWGGIFFDQTADYLSQLDHCVLQHAGGDDGYGASLAAERASLHVNNTRILKTRNYGVYLYESHAVLESVHILSSGRAGLSADSSGFTLTNSKIRRSGSLGDYGIDVSGDSETTPILENNLIEDGLHAPTAVSLSGNTLVPNRDTHVMALVTPQEVEELVTLNDVSQADSSTRLELAAGLISSDTSWPNPGFSIALTGDISVHGDQVTPATLTIEPGVVVRFPVGGSLVISHPRAALVAQGTSDQSITFTADSDSPIPGFWNGITFSGDTPTQRSTLENCIVEYGGGDPAAHGAEIVLTGASPTFRRCQIRNSSGNGILGTPEAGVQCSPTIDGNTFTGNGDYDVKLLGQGSATVTGNTFSRAAWIEGTPTIQENTFNGYSTAGSGCWRDGMSQPCMLRIGTRGLAALSGNVFNDLDVNSRIEVVPNECYAGGQQFAAQECSWWVSVLGEPLAAPSVDPDTGFPPFGSFAADSFGGINRQNLNLNISIPVASSAGRGVSLEHSLVNDTVSYFQFGGRWIPFNNNPSYRTWGWATAHPTGLIQYSTATAECQAVILYPPGTWLTYTRYSNFSYTDVHGTRHGFSVSLDDVPWACLYPAGQQTSGYATDQSGYYIQASGGGETVVRAPNGTLIEENGTVTDRNGNRIAPVPIDSQETDWIDSAGRTALKMKKSAECTVNCPSGSDYVDYLSPTPNGDYQATRLTFANMNIMTGFGCSGISEYTGSARLPVSLSLPNGQAYAFEYETSPGYPGCTTGRIRKISLPTGGYYQYSYTGAHDGIICADGSASGLIRTISDGTTESTWQFVRSLAGTTWRTKEISPKLPYDAVSNETVYAFPTKKPASISIYQGSEASGTLLRTISIEYAANGTPSVRTTTLDAAPLEFTQEQSEVETAYDDYGNLLSIQEHGYHNTLLGPLSPSPVLRTTTFSYLADPQYVGRNMRRLLSQMIVRDGGASGPVKSRVDLGYDSNPLSCVLGASQHDDIGHGCSFLPRGNVTSVTEYAEPSLLVGSTTKNFFYDSLGNLVRADVDCCQQKQWAYSATTQWSEPDSETDGPIDGPQLMRSFGYSSATGLTTSATDENLKTTTYAYDILRRPIRVTRPDSSAVTITYDDANRIATTEVPIEGQDREVVTVTYDGLGQARKFVVSDRLGTVYSTVEVQRDAFGRSYRTSNPYVGTPAWWTERRFDVLGRPTMVIPPDGTATANNWTYAYSGASLTATDPASKQMRSHFDSLARLVKATEPDPDSGLLTQDTTYSYDPRNLLTTVAQGAQVRSYVYDGIGRLITEVAPERACVGYVYNSRGLLAQRVDSRHPGGGVGPVNNLVGQPTACAGVSTYYTYDGLNRLEHVGYDTGTTGVPFTYGTTYIYGNNSTLNNNGRIVSMTDGSGGETYQYDALGRVLEVSKTTDGTMFAIGYNYNQAGELTDMSYPSGRPIHYDYDPIGRLKSVSSQNLVYLDVETYNAANQATSVQYGNGTAGIFTFSPSRLELNSINYLEQSTSMFSVTYGYNQPNGGDNGLITQITDSVNPGRSVIYEYDSMNRLSEASTTGSLQYPPWRLQWTYDRYGNRSSQAAVAGSVPNTTFSFDPLTNRISSAGYTYDGNGNLIQSHGTTLNSSSFVYDGENRLVGYNGPAGHAAYYYDGLNHRVKRIDASGRHLVDVYSGTAVVAEYVDGALQRENIYAGDKPVATYEGGSAYYYYRDHLSVRLTADGNGHSVSEQGHLPFGEKWYGSSASSDEVFTTYVRDSESGLDYAKSRYYDSSTGRFVSKDPLMGEVPEPQTQNGYSYVVNDPINRVDPLGLSSRTCVLWHCDDIDYDGTYGYTSCYVKNVWECGSGSTVQRVTTGRGGGGRPGVKGNQKCAAPITSTNYLLGLGVSLVWPLGVEGSMGAVYNPGSGENGQFGFGIFFSGGVGAGANVSADPVLSGFVRGNSVADLQGSTVNVNGTAFIFSPTIINVPGVGPVGGTLGAGPSVFPIGASVTKTGTFVMQPSCGRFPPN